ncbi:MAG TPA: type II secretion system F family protein [Acidimicrobiales bacterium]|nr:type II secretion system F family protein [Acidimicrobiales bacterium]
MIVAGFVGGAWSALVVIGACRHRRLPRRPLPHPGPTPTPSLFVGRRWLVVDAVGRAILGLAPGSRRGVRTPSGPAPAPAAARRVGTVVIASSICLAVLPVLAPVALLAGGAWPRVRARREERRRLLRLEAGLPEVVDLLALAVGAGANVSHAVAAAARRGTGPLAEELARITTQVGRGQRVADALDELPRRAGEAVRPLAAALSACDRYGAPLGTSLERLADEVRRQRRRRAEEAARKVPVVLLFPLVLCILPAFALLTVAPLVAGALRALRL